MIYYLKAIVIKSTQRHLKSGGGAHFIVSKLPLTKNLTERFENKRL